ncbi:MAG: DinB family protein [Planctomycetes bacterium]|nr:DinB family protein [Planctomycetota bacterium]
MESIANAIRARVAAVVPKLIAMPEAEAARKPSLDRWCKKEILGHLIDSASNNHQRFVRAQLQGGLSFPGYEQEGWARCQAYATADWRLLVELWSSYSRHLANVIARMPDSALGAECRIEGREPVMLKWLVEDYVRHMDHHVAQLGVPPSQDV